MGNKDCVPTPFSEPVLYSCVSAVGITYGVLLSSVWDLLYVQCNDDVAACVAECMTYMCVLSKDGNGMHYCTVINVSRLIELICLPQATLERSGRLDLLR